MSIQEDSPSSDESVTSRLDASVHMDVSPASSDEDKSSAPASPSEELLVVVPSTAADREIIVPSSAVEREIVWDEEVLAAVPSAAADREVVVPSAAAAVPSSFVADRQIEVPYAAAALHSGATASSSEFPCTVLAVVPFDPSSACPYQYVDQKLVAELYTMLPTDEFAGVSHARPPSGFLSDEKAAQIGDDFRAEQVFMLSTGSEKYLSDYRAYLTLYVDLLIDIASGTPENAARYAGRCDDVYCKVFEELFEIYHGYKYAHIPSTVADSFNSSSNISEGESFAKSCRDIYTLRLRSMGLENKFRMLLMTLLGVSEGLGGMPAFLMQVEMSL